MTQYLIEAVNDQNEVLSIPIGDSVDGISFQGLSGTDPVASTLISSSFGLLDGEEYQGSSETKRNLILKLGMSANYPLVSVATRRRRLYDWFSSGQQITLNIYDDEYVPVQINCVVETNESPSNDKDPSMTVSLIAHKPDFLGFETYSVGTTYGDPDADGVITQEYIGNKESGIHLVVDIPRTLSGFTFNLGRANDNQQIVFSWPLLTADSIDISTVGGDKHVRLIRGTTTTEILSAISPDSDWAVFKKGLNVMSIVAPDGLPLTYQVDWIARFGGL